MLTGRTAFPLRTAEQHPGYDRFRSDDFARFEMQTPEQELEKRRSDLRNGLTNKQRLFLFGKLSGLNDKNAALAAGYALSVAENTKQRIWKPRVRTEWERMRSEVAATLLREQDSLISHTVRSGGCNGRDF